MHNKRFYLLILIFSLVFLNSCSDDIDFDFEQSLFGNWRLEEQTDSVRIFEKLSKVPSDDYCIIFNNNNKLVEQKNSGWCGTPPIAYAQYDGKWSISGDSVVSIQTTYWGGEANYKWKVLWISNNQLCVKIINENYSFNK